MFWIQFAVSSAVIVFAGVKLTKYADIISDRSGWGKIWVGALLLGFITSLPEAITSFSSVVYLHANDLAVGNLLGSNTFNPMIIVILDILFKGDSITNKIVPEKSYNISAFFAIILTFFVLLEIVFSYVGIILSWGRLSIWGLAICAFYFLGMRRLLFAEKNTLSLEEKREYDKQKLSVVVLYAKAFVSAVIIIISAIFLSDSADLIAKNTGWGRTFVGSLFLAFATSLPEIVVSISALRLGSVGMAVGNIFGSNMTNMFILVICGLFSNVSPMISMVSRTHIVTASMCIVLMTIMILGIHKKKKTIFNIGIDSIAMLAVFIIGMRILFVLRQ